MNWVLRHPLSSLPCCTPVLDGEQPSPKDLCYLLMFGLGIWYSQHFRYSQHFGSFWKWKFLEDDIIFHVIIQSVYVSFFIMS